MTEPETVSDLAAGITPKAPSPLWPFAGVVALVAGVFRIGILAVSRLDVPALLEWLNPFELYGQMTFLFGAGLYGAREGAAMISTMTTTALVTMGALMVLAAAVRLARGPARPVGVALLTGLFLLPAIPGEALEVRRAEEGGDLTVPASETIDESLVVMGETVTVEGAVRGDLIAMGRRVRVRGMRGDRS